MAEQSTQLAVGQRLRCERCGTEILALTVAGEPSVTCCDSPLTVIFTRSPS